MESSVFDLNVPETLRFTRRGHLMSQRERKFVLDCQKKYIHLRDIARQYNERVPNETFDTMAALAELTRKCFDYMLTVNQTTYFMFQFNAMISDYETMLESIMAEVRKIGPSRVLMF